MSRMYNHGLKTCSIKLSSGPSSRVALAPARLAAPVAVRPIDDLGPDDEPCTNCASAPELLSVAFSDSASADHTSEGTLGDSKRPNALSISPSTDIILPRLVR